MSDKHIITTSWNGGMAFETDVDGHSVKMDASSAFGGNDTGPSPKKLMLVALSGCTGMDIVAILKKMRVDIDKLEIEVQGDVTDEPPKHYHKMHVIYHVYGKDLPLDKLEKAVKMSEDTYCGVRAAYAKGMELSSEIRIVED